ncbi:uncharacterized protein CTRU02_209334 [Colletotrichum truncatum]|uniref:Uncharacterized protein n=1 Tax=Colletotrichum truncatum TaxID=5467 RepID=A0ACC3YS26_COLTU|nr:uncharacterized protein CTRU02_08591 [Colletotrichum truncatum]KAF6789892.1 hypothetical protein CTRU02_08591 [Colletotrichum truncatum]
MHFPTIIAALTQASLISAYTSYHSKQYCDQTRPVVIRYNAAVGTCYNIDGAASYEFGGVGAPNRWVCSVYTQGDCKGKAAAYTSNSESTTCTNSPIGWIYSYKCSFI